MRRLPDPFVSRASGPFPPPLPRSRARACLCRSRDAVAASIEARHGAVAAEHRLASAAGVEILERGGNAVDAAVAAALATGVVNPSSSGLGGGGFLVAWDARRARASTIDFREAAPSGAYETMFVSADGSVDARASRIGALAVGVPGEPRGLALALQRHGRLRFADVAAPAIRIAREGFVIEAHLASMIASAKTGLPADPELARVFFHEDGSPRREGETLKRPELAATLERLARVGVDDFYEGEIAADIARTLAAANATGATTAGSGTPAGPAAAPRGAGAVPVTAKDLAAYRPIEREPLRIGYRGRRIYSMPPPSSGGAVLGEALGVLSAWDIAGIDRQGPTWAHLMAETLKAVFADRATVLRRSRLHRRSARTSARPRPRRRNPLEDELEARHAIGRVRTTRRRGRRRGHLAHLGHRRRRQRRRADHQREHRLRQRPVGSGTRHRAEQHDGRLLGPARQGQRLRPRRQPGQRDRAGQAAAVEHDAGHRARRRPRAPGRGSIRRPAHHHVHAARR